MAPAARALLRRILDFGSRAWGQHRSARFPALLLWPRACEHRTPCPWRNDWRHTSRIEGCRRRSLVREQKGAPKVTYLRGPAPREKSVLVARRRSAPQERPSALRRLCVKSAEAF